MVVFLWLRLTFTPIFFAALFQNLSWVNARLLGSIWYMLKIYKRTIHIGTPEHIQRVDSSAYYGQKKSVSQRIFSVLTIPAMIAGAILGTLMFSIFFAVLLIPMGVIGFRAWRLMKIAKQKARDQSIDAEFTVIDDRDNQ
jgi:uncharacterized membrane protein